MKLNRIAIAAGILLGASSGAFAQSSATIIQSGSGDTATIEQNTVAPGSVATGSIIQSGGAGNTASVLQVPNGPPATISASASVSQSGTVGDTARVVQIGTTNGTNLQLSQSAGSGTVADLFQGDVSASRIRTFQSASASNLMIQQTAGTSSSYAAGEQGGQGHTLTILQGQPGAGVAATQARAWQYGDGNSSFTLQYGVSGTSSYISQGSGPYMPGYYFVAPGPGVGTWVEVDRNIVGGPAQNSSANVTQNSGSNLTGYILQYGSQQNASLNQTGNGNLGGVLQTGFGNSGNITQSGAMNTGTISQQGSGASAFLSQSGGGNNASIKQR